MSSQTENIESDHANPLNIQISIPSVLRIANEEHLVIPDHIKLIDSNMNSNVRILTNSPLCKPRPLGRSNFSNAQNNESKYIKNIDQLAYSNELILVPSSQFFSPETSPFKRLDFNGQASRRISTPLMTEKVENTSETQFEISPIQSSRKRKRAGPRNLTASFLSSMNSPVDDENLENQDFKVKQPRCENIDSLDVSAPIKRGRPKLEAIKCMINRAAESNSNIRCRLCNRVFPREKSLQAHIRTHTGEKPYECDYPGCLRRFAQSGQLRTHQRLHTGEKPFVCGFKECQNRFTHANRHCPLHPAYGVKRDMTRQNTSAPSSELNTSNMSDGIDLKKNNIRAAKADQVLLSSNGSDVVDQRNVLFISRFREQQVQVPHSTTSEAFDANIIWKKKRAALQLREKGNDLDLDETSFLEKSEEGNILLSNIEEPLKDEDEDAGICESSGFNFSQDESNIPSDQLMGALALIELASRGNSEIACDLDISSTSDLHTDPNNAFPSSPLQLDFDSSNFSDKNSIEDVLSE